MACDVPPQPIIFADRGGKRPARGMDQERFAPRFGERLAHLENLIAMRLLCRYPRIGDVKKGIPMMPFDYTVCPVLRFSA